MVGTKSSISPSRSSSLEIATKRSCAIAEKASVPVVLGFFGLRYAEKRAKEKAALQDASAEESPEAVDAGDEED